MSAERWVLLEVDRDVMCEGDEQLTPPHLNWTRVPDECIGQPVTPDHYPIRRRWPPPATHSEPPARLTDEDALDRACAAYLAHRGTYEGEVPLDREDMRAALQAAYPKLAEQSLERDAILSSLAEVVEGNKELREVLVDGYAGAFYATPSSGDKPQIHLYYSTNEQAEAAMEAWCKFMDAAIAEQDVTGGGG